MKTEPDEEAIARQELGDIVRLSEEGVALFAERARECRDVFWNGTASVESKLKVLGTNAIAMFQESGRAQKIIKSYNPDHVELGIPDEWDVKFNGDGSITANIKPITE